MLYNELMRSVWVVSLRLSAIVMLNHFYLSNVQDTLVTLITVVVVICSNM